MRAGIREEEPRQGWVVDHEPFRRHCPYGGVVLRRAVACAGHIPWEKEDDLQVAAK